MLREAGSDDLAAQAALWHGDALLLDGQIDEARQAWQQAQEPLKTFRDVYAEVYRSESENWIALMPILLSWTQEDGPRAAEARHLIAQIDESLGLDVDAIDGYATFVDDHPSLAVRSDVPQRLWALYAQRVHALHDAQKWYALAAVHESAWRDILFDEIDDPVVLWEVSQGYEALGLHRKALDVLSTGFARMVSDGLEHPEMTLNLARLYEKLDNDRDGLKTIDFLREMSVPDAMAGDVALMSGRMLLGQGEEAAAVLELQRARRVPAQRDEANLILARIDAQRGQCGRAVGPLKALLLSDSGRQRWSDPAPYLELTRCAASLDDMPLASDAALAAAERASSTDEARYAGYLHQLYSDPAQVPEMLADGEDIWATLGRARAAEEAFQDTVDDRLRR
jgi:predicted negative regulator of RcsB-dependent stress response